MRIAVFGGSFNPLHIGHLFIAETARDELGYDKVIFVPSNISSHKEDKTGLDSESRLKMVVEALKPFEYFMVEPCDIIRGGISFSIDTIEHIYMNYKFDGKPGFIIGDDLLPGFNTWKNAEKLKSRIDLIVVKRHSTDRLDSVYPDYYIDNAILPVSSTAIRERVRQGKTIKNLVPEPVRECILRNGYYR